jgi:hypothetical protein
MATCSNCKTTLSCGCQKRTASDGNAVCSNCLTSYEANLKQKATAITVSPTSQVWGKDRYKIAK